ncbi:hypothetical protein ALC152_14750 [Arcobacter sp. 15-2]|uniref:hypothetical protein n=1 Tax=Arcobacter sp. 15-2 TaxID=3374109 RepID=UPI00399D2A30
MEITPQKIVEIASYFTVISHTKGRLRVRVNPKIKDEVSDVSLSDIETLPQKINGIKKIKINKIIASVTIEYNNEIFPKEKWDDLINGENLDEVVKIIENLKKEIN